MALLDSHTIGPGVESKLVDGADDCGAVSKPVAVARGVGLRLVRVYLRMLTAQAMTRAVVERAIAPWTAIKALAHRVSGRCRWERTRSRW